MTKARLPPGSFDVIPSLAWRFRREGRISGVDLEALALVTRYASRGKLISLRSTYWLAEQGNWDRKNLARSVARLVAVGILIRTIHPRYKRPAYLINWEPTFETPSERTADLFSADQTAVGADGGFDVGTDDVCETPSAPTADFGPDIGGIPAHIEKRRRDGRRGAVGTDGEFDVEADGAHNIKQQKNIKSGSGRGSPAREHDLNRILEKRLKNSRR